MDQFGPMDSSVEVYEDLASFSPGELVDVIRDECLLSVETQYMISKMVMDKNPTVFFGYPRVVVNNQQQGFNFGTDDFYNEPDVHPLRASRKYCSGELTMRELAFMVLVLEYPRCFYKQCKSDPDFNDVCANILNNIDGLVPEESQYIKSFLISVWG